MTNIQFDTQLRKWSGTRGLRAQDTKHPIIPTHIHCTTDVGLIVPL